MSDRITKERMDGIRNDFIEKHISSDFYDRVVSTLVATSMLETFHTWSSARAKEGKSLDDDLVLFNVCKMIAMQIMCYGAHQAMSNTAGVDFVEDFCKNQSKKLDSEISRIFEIIRESSSFDSVEDAFDAMEKKLNETMEDRDGTSKSKD